MSTLDGIDIQGETIGHALKDSRLAVPVNQRSYAWEEKHVVELYQDLANAIATSETEYFLGSIVVTRSGDGVPEVVDGQQRLATSIILLAAIRDYFYINKDEDRGNDIESAFLKSRDLRTQEELPRLRLNDTDNDYFSKRILSRPDHPDRDRPATKDSHKRIDTAAKLAKKQVDSVVGNFAAQDRSERLLDWIEFIEERARVIWVTVPDQANAFVIFETLNDRGLALSISDLLKNYLLGLSDDRIRETQSSWYSMTGALETVGGEEIVVTYIRHLWISLHGPTRERELYGKIKTQIRNKQVAITFATELAENANLYAALLNNQHELWNTYPPSSRGHLDTLRLLRMEQLRPVLLAAVKHLPPKEVAKCLRLLVCAAVRFLIVGKVAGGIQERNYALRALDIRKSVIRTARQLEKAMADVVPGDAQFEAAFGTARVSRSDLARYYLRALESKAAGGDQPELVPNDDEVINLEHVLPQSPGSLWSALDDETARGFHKRLGNMCLLKAKANAKIGNASLAQKKPHYTGSSFELTKRIAAYTNWGPDEIAERQQELASLAVKTWPFKQ